MIPTVHPFPARMAPELALQALGQLARGSIVLDPMAGSGTVLRQASDLGHRAIGFDLDPLAVLMTRVWTHPVSDEIIGKVYDRVIRRALSLGPDDVYIPWIDDDEETRQFISYWFGVTQRRDLRCVAYAISEYAKSGEGAEEQGALDVLRVALSRIIITKEQCASLARDTSHSRPHRVATQSSYAVFPGLDRSMKTVRKRLLDAPPRGDVEIQLGDARAILLPSSSVDCVLTSPPYLNAIDYMRGHRMSLVWLGYSLGALREVRGTAIGAEKAASSYLSDHASLMAAFGVLDELPARQRAMIARYAVDIRTMVGEAARVLSPTGVATFVVGNSCLKGVFIRNAEAVAKAAEQAGMELVGRFERELPPSNRYLPTGSGSALHKRMRTETILTTRLRH